MINVTEEDEEVNAQQWKKVSPEKASRSPLKQELQFGHVRIATPSRFVALSVLDEENEEGNHKQMEEGEIHQEESGSKKQDDGKLKRIEMEGGRQMLPRESKTRYKILSAASNHTKNDLGNMERSTQRNH